MVVEEKGGGEGGGGRKAKSSDVDAGERSECGLSGDGASVGCERGASVVRAWAWCEQRGFVLKKAV